MHLPVTWGPHCVAGSDAAGPGEGLGVGIPNVFSSDAHADTEESQRPLKTAKKGSSGAIPCPLQYPPPLSGRGGRCCSVPALSIAFLRLQQPRESAVSQGN